MLTQLLEVCFPLACLACQAPLVGNASLCTDCGVALEPLGRSTCIRCAEPQTPAGTMCERCRLEPLAFNRALAAYLHGATAAALVHRFKYEDHPELAPGLAELTLQALEPLRAFTGIVCAVPLHTKRLRTRGYDQAQLFAKELARRIEQPFGGRLLERTVPTAPQVGLSLEERRTNVRNAFIASPQVVGQDILLVDDVMTTGATLDAAARALQQANARHVFACAFARAQARDAGERYGARA
ncbi:MAG: ComF family protein [Myxococcaceae bacterium]